MNGYWFFLPLCIPSFSNQFSKFTSTSHAGFCSSFSPQWKWTIYFYRLFLVFYLVSRVCLVSLKSLAKRLQGISALDHVTTCLLVSSMMWIYQGFWLLPYCFLEPFQDNMIVFATGPSLAPEQSQVRAHTPLLVAHMFHWVPLEHHLILLKLQHPPEVWSNFSDGCRKSGIAWEISLDLLCWTQERKK